MSHIIMLPYQVVYSLNNNGIFEDPKALEDICQGCKHPLPVTVASPRRNDEQCEQDSQYIQHIFPFTLDLLPVLTAFGHISTIRDKPHELVRIVNSCPPVRSFT